MNKNSIADKDVDDFTELWLKNSKLNLELAGIMYVNAVLQYKQGEKYYNKLELERQKYSEAYSKRAQKFETSSESFYTYILPRLRNIEVIYEPTVRYFSTCKILLVCCAETYINEVADVKLTGRLFSEFDKLSIVGKWIFIQDVLKLKKKITIDRNPLQDFSTLVSERNKLVHFKGIKKDLSPFQIPDFLESLKLTPKDCSKNIAAVKGLITSLSTKWTGSNGPDWLNADKRKYRNPCFYTGSREYPWILHSNKYDKNLYNE